MHASEECLGMRGWPAIELLRPMATTYLAMHPPSVTSMRPVVKLDASDAR